jgi:FkbM family methyltransferase
VDEVYLFRSEEKSPFIIDCGSNIGLSIVYFKKLFPESEIIGFEPDPKNFEILTHNVNSFSLSKVNLINKAVWKQNDELVFESSGSIGSKLTSRPALKNKSIKVLAVSLSDFIKDRKVDFLKIDIEGAEYEVLDSCRIHLKNIRNLFIEYHSMPGENQQLSNLLTILQEAGFRYYIKEAWENMKRPYIDQRTVKFDLQLNIFAYRSA